MPYKAAKRYIRHETLPNTTAALTRPAQRLAVFLRREECSVDRIARQQTTDYQQKPSTAMSTKPQDAVWISRETAETALTELNNLLDYADAEMETAGVRAAMDDLWHALEADDDEPRTSVTSSGEFDKLAIDGVADGAVVIDHGRTPPRAIITTDGGEVPTDIIELPADNERNTGKSESGPETAATDGSDRRGGD